MFIAAFAPYITYKFLSFVGFDMYHAMSSEQEAKSALNRPVPVPNSPMIDGAKKILGPGGDGGSGKPAPEALHRRAHRASADTGAASSAAGSGSAGASGTGAGGGTAAKSGTGGGGRCGRGRQRGCRCRRGGCRCRRDGGPKGRQLSRTDSGCPHAVRRRRSSTTANRIPPGRPTRASKGPLAFSAGCLPVSWTSTEGRVVMDTDTNRAAYQLTPVQFSRLTRRGILLGLSVPQLVALSIGTLTIVAALYVAGASGVAWTSPIWGTAAVTAGIPISGRKIVEWVPIVSRWMWRAARGQLTYRRRIIRPRPVGTLALPGDAAALREWSDPESGAVMIHDPHAQTLTAIVAVSHPAFALLDPGEQNRRVAGWGRVLAGACRSGRIARLQVSERTLPDSGTGLAEWWERHGIDDNSWAASHLPRSHRARRTGRRTPRDDDQPLPRPDSSLPSGPHPGRRHARRGDGAPPRDDRSDRSAARSGPHRGQLARRGRARQYPANRVRPGRRRRPGTTC